MKVNIRMYETLIRKCINIFLCVSMFFHVVTYNISADHNVPDSAWDLLPELNVGWNLGNSLENQNLDYGYIGYDQYGQGFSVFEERLGNPVVTEGMIKAIAQAGFSSIRIPLSFYNHLLESAPRDSSGAHPGVTIDEKWLARIKEIVDWSLDAGLYVVINNHHDSSMWMNLSWIYADEDTIDEQIENLCNIWSQVADYFKDYDSRLIFQSTGEIVNQERSFNAVDYRDFQMAHDINQAFINTIRNSGGNNTDRFLILETYAANSGNLFVDQSFYKAYEDSAKDKLIFGVHNYSSDVEVLEFTFKELYKRAHKYNMPFIVDECGTVASLEEKQRVEIAETLVSQAKKYGMAIMIWDDGVSEFGLIDRKASNDNKTLVYKDENSKKIVQAMIEKNNSTDKISEEERQRILAEGFTFRDFEGLNKDNIDILFPGQYSETHKDAYNPVSEYLNSPAHFAALRPYYNAKGAHFVSKLPDDISTIVVKEFDENGYFIRSRYTSDGILFVPSNDVEYIAIYFRTNNENLNIDDYIDYVKQGELYLNQSGYDYSEYICQLISAQRQDEDNSKVKIDWKKLDIADGYQVFRKDVTDTAFKPVSDYLGKDDLSYVDNLSVEKGAYYTVRAYVNINNKRIWTGYDEKGIKVSSLTDSLNDKKEAAKKELDDYKDPRNYFEKELNELNNIINKGKTDIDAAKTAEEIDDIVRDTKKQLDKIKEIKGSFYYAGSNIVWYKDSNINSDIFIFRNNLNEEAAYDSFKGIRIDDGVLMNKDDSAFIYSKGSLEIILKKQMLNSLAVGRHLLNVVFEVNEKEYEVPVYFFIERLNRTKAYSIPQTGI